MFDDFDTQLSAEERYGSMADSPIDLYDENDIDRPSEELVREWPF